MIQPVPAIDKEHRRWFARRATMLAATVVASIAFLIGLREWRLHIPQMPFDAEAWKRADDVWTSPQTPTVRHEMIRDLITNVLPGKDRTQIEKILGKSWSHADMRRHTDADFKQTPKRNAHGEYEPYPQTGDGWYFDEYDWDMLYPIGKEQVFIYDHRGVFAAALSPDDEYLILRLDPNGRYNSWFIFGSTRWPGIVGEPGCRQFARPRPLPHVRLL